MSTASSSRPGTGKVTQLKMPVKYDREDCCIPAEETAVTIPEKDAGKPEVDWEMEQPPYYHRDIF